MSSKELNDYCLMRIFEELGFQDLLNSRLVSSTWCSIIDQRLSRVKKLSIIGINFQPRVKTHFLFDQANCCNHNHRLESKSSKTQIVVYIQGARDRTHWRLISESIFRLIRRVFTMLEVLIIDCFYHWMSADQWRMLASNLPNLQHINVINCSLVDEMINFSGKSLQHLELHDSFFYNPQKLSSIIKRNSNLKTFLCQGPDNLETNLDFTPEICQQITTFKMIGSYLATGFVGKMAQFSPNSVTDLHLSFITNKHLELICTSMQSLQALRFWANLIDLRKLSHLVNIEKLEFTCIGSRSSNFNSDLSAFTKSCSKLKSLTIKCPLLNDNSSAIISSNCPFLVCLRLIDCNYMETTYQSLHHFKNLNRIKILEITHTKVDAPSLAQFMNQMRSITLLSAVNNELVDHKTLLSLIDKNIRIRQVFSEKKKNWTLTQSSPKTPTTFQLEDIRYLIIGQINYDYFIPSIPEIGDSNEKNFQ